MSTPEMRRSSSEPELIVPTRQRPLKLLAGLRRRRRPSVPSAPKTSSFAPTPRCETFGQYVADEMKGPDQLQELLYAGGNSGLLETKGSVVLPYARRNLRLSFLQCDGDGTITRRVQTRLEILNEVRQNWDMFHDQTAQRLPRRHQVRVTRDETADKSATRRGRNGRGKQAAPRYLSRFAAPQTPHSAIYERRTSGNRLSVRDMRQIDPAFTAKPAIWVREDAMVVSLESVRAIILHNKMFIFDPDNEKVQTPIRYIRKRLANNLEDVFLPFEFRALEGILIHACMVLEKEFMDIEPGLMSTLGDLPSRINNEQLENLRLLEQRLNHYYSRARKVQQALQAVLDEDEDMADMYLTEKRKNPTIVRNPVDHDEAEMLLETYLQNVDDFTSKAGLLNQAIDDTENLIEIHLDTMQNRLLLVDLIITVISTILAFGTMMTSIFGMNFPLPDEFAELPSSQYYFLGLVLITFMVMGIALVLLTKWCRRQGIYRGRTKTARVTNAPPPAVKIGEETRRQAAELLAQPPRISHAKSYRLAGQDDGLDGWESMEGGEVGEHLL